MEMFSGSMEMFSGSMGMFSGSMAAVPDAKIRLLQQI
jgi:hypothetical protein